MAKERNELAGDERFYDFLDQDLKDTSEEAVERLAVYYVCAGLGFMGMYQGQPDQIRRYMEQIFPRVVSGLIPIPGPRSVKRPTNPLIHGC